MPTTWYCAAPSARRAGNCATSPCSNGFRAAAFALLAALGLSSAAQAQYCAASATNCTAAGADERISHVTFAGIDNDSGTGNAPAGCYTDFTAIAGATVSPGSTYPFSVTNAGPFTGDWAAVWVDWNQDNIFDVATEQVILTTADANVTFTGSISVPSGATLGATRLRVRVCYSTGRTPCGNAGYGEVEDYTVNVINPTTGACCTTAGVCTQTTSVACGGSFSGNGTACSPNPCQGACCTASGACSLTGTGNCAGTFQGLASTCSPSNPCGGSCCTGSTCTVTTAASCPSGSLYIDHAPCTAASCNYCTAGSTNCGSANNDERISHVTFGLIDNDSGTGDGPGGCYTDFTSISTVLYPGQTYPITVLNATNGEWPEDQCAVWIDFNGDFTFDVATEQTTLTSADTGATFTGSITVPSNARIGPTRMRIRVTYTGAVAPCGNATFGEVEDYGIAIAVATNGACCQTSGACTETLPGACTGTFSGVGTACAPTNPCGGACCNGTTGNCTVTTAATCPSGSIYSNGRVCTPTFCNGACCDAGGICTLVANAAACTGTFSGVNTLCAPSPCPGQSCASPLPLTLGVSVAGDLAASTTNSTITCSSGVKGLWYSFTAPADGSYNFNSTLTSGAGNPSLGLFGPCGTQLACVNPCAGTNTNALQTMTAGQQIVFRAGGCGDVTLTYSVTVSIAIVGACCNDTSGACVLSSTAASGCATGTTYQGDNTACSATQCGQGACCNPTNGTCTLSTLTGCTTGQFQSVGTVCTPTNPCPQPPTGACCNSTTGACTQVFAINCSATTSTYSGDNSTCNISGFCPGSGTCCSPMGNCVVIYSGSCAAGLTSNAATTCTAGLCPASGARTCENFDSGSAGTLPNNWSSTSTGAGAPWVIDATHSYSPSNAVFSNDVASVSAQFLQLPAVTAGGNLSLEFWSYFDTETNWDGWVVEYSTDAGGTWTDVGTAGFSLNGYNNAALNASPNPLTGRPAFSGVFTTWTLHIASIPATAGQSVIVRFQVASDDSVSHVGVWLDDICIGGIQSAVGGVCCRGSTCNTSFATAADCAAANDTVAPATVLSKFVPATAACNTPVTVPGTLGNTTSPCCYANYNHNATLEVQDIFDFLNDWFAGKKGAVVGGNGTTGTLQVQNIFDFLNSWFAGGCN